MILNVLFVICFKYSWLQFFFNYYFFQAWSLKHFVFLYFLLFKQNMLLQRFELLAFCVFNNESCINLLFSTVLEDIRSWEDRWIALLYVYLEDVESNLLIYLSSVVLGDVRLCNYYFSGWISNIIPNISLTGFWRKRRCDSRLDDKLEEIVNKSIFL